MENRHLGKIIGLSLFMFVVSFGGNLEDFLRAGADSNKALLWNLIGFCIAIVIAMIVPFACRLAKKAKLPYKSGKKLCIWNSVGAFLLSCVIYNFTDIIFVSWLGAIIFYFFNKWIFVEDPLLVGVGADVAHDTDEGETVDCSDTVAHQAPVATPKTKVRYCSRCGGAIDPSTKKCSGCGKQYFKVPSKKTVIFAVLAIVLGISVATNFILLTRDSEHSNNGAIREVKVRMVTIDNYWTAELALLKIETGPQTEEHVVEVMRTYGSTGNDGTLLTVEPGHFVDDVNAWCFDKDRQAGDYAVIENVYGFTLCYISSVSRE